MTASGKITFVDKVSGAAELSAGVSSGDSVLLVDDAGAFDEEFLEPRYLAIGDDLVRHEYVSVENDDEAQQSVTLAGTAGDTYEAGLPIYLWDPEADGDDKRAVSVDAQVRLDGQDAAVPVTIRHALAPQANSLTGATVTIGEDDDGEPFVEEVRSRKSVITGTTVQTGEEGQRVVVTVVNNTGTMLLYTGNEREDPAEPGYVTSSATDLGGGSVILQTAIAGPRIEGSLDAPTISLTAMDVAGTENTFVVVTATELTLNGELDVSSLADGGSRNQNSGNKYVRAGADGGLFSSALAPSSRTVKHDIQPLDLDPDALLALRPVTFRYNEAPDTVRVGFIAEEARDLGLGPLVGYEDNADPERVTGFDYDGMGAGLLAVDQHQQAQIEGLKGEVADLKALVQELLSR